MTFFPESEHTDMAREMLAMAAAANAAKLEGHIASLRLQIGEVRAELDDGRTTSYGRDNWEALAELRTALAEAQATLEALQRVKTEG